jgi:hypothetical protein
MRANENFKQNSRKNRSKQGSSLPESGSLPSARRFAECCTRQSFTLENDRVCRDQDSQHRKTLGKDYFVECQTLGAIRRSAKNRQQPSIADGRYLCRAPGFGTRERSYFTKCPTPDGALGKEAILPSVLPQRGNRLVVHSHSISSASKEHELEPSHTTSAGQLTLSHTTTRG